MMEVLLTEQQKLSCRAGMDQENIELCITTMNLWFCDVSHSLCIKNNFSAI